jgi:replicative DNA helicase
MSKTLEKAIQKVETQKNTQTQFVSSHKAVSELWDTLMKKDFERIIKFPYDHLNKRLRGIFPTSFIVVGADTGAGKSELLGQIAYSAAEQKKRVLYFDFENDAGDFYARLITREMSKKLDKEFTVADLKLMDVDKHPHAGLAFGVAASLSEKCETVRLYNNEEIPTVERFVAILEAISGEVDLVCVDHLHYFDFESSKDTHSQQISMVMRALNRLTRKRIPIILASHLKERKGTNKTPSNYDLFGSSNIAKEAKAVVLMHREDQHTVFQITKNREGVKLSKYKCKFNPIGRVFLFEGQAGFEE